MYDHIKNCFPCLLIFGTSFGVIQDPKMHKFCVGTVRDEGKIL